MFLFERCISDVSLQSSSLLWNNQCCLRNVHLLTKMKEEDHMQKLAFIRNLNCSVWNTYGYECILLITDVPGAASSIFLLSMADTLNIGLLQNYLSISFQSSGIKQNSIWFGSCSGVDDSVDGSLSSHPFWSNVAGLLETFQLKHTNKSVTVIKNLNG